MNPPASAEVLSKNKQYDLEEVYPRADKYGDGPLDVHELHAVEFVKISSAAVCKWLFQK